MKKNPTYTDEPMEFKVVKDVLPPLKHVSEQNAGTIVLYRNRIEVQLRDDTVWLSQKQMAELFDKNIRTINEHIVNVFKEKELLKGSVIRNFRITASDGKSYDTMCYNLDVIISVGYRVKSRQGTQFRIWATTVLKQHLIDGYTINQQRLEKEQRKFAELKKAVALLGNVARLEDLSVEAKGLAQVIAEYARALDLLDDFDRGKVTVPKGRTRGTYVLTYDDACAVIQAMRKKFGDSGLVGREKDESFKSSLGSIYQTIGGKDAYPSIEEKAANLLYFVTKNHSFVDGNKRIAAALFVCFLQRNNALYRKNGSRVIDDNALVALTLMVAASDPRDKDIMTRVIVNVLCAEMKR